MNRRRLRLALRDLGAASAFVSMALSGQVPAWAMGLFGSGLALALLDRRVFEHRSRISAGVLLACALGLYAMVAAGRLDLVVAACSFAGLLACQRMLALPGETTDQQVHLTSLLMIAGGAALSGDLLFAPCLAAFAIFASLSLGMSVVDANRGSSEAVRTGPLVRVLAWGVAFALVGGVAFFILVPRLSWSLAGRRSGVGLGIPSSGFSDRVQIGGSGRIKTNPRVVFRATLTPDPKVDALGAYWVGKSFDTFNGIEWSGSARPLPAQLEVTLLHGGKQLVLQQLELLPAYGSRTLVGLDVPIMFGSGVAHLPTRNARARLVVLPAQEVRFESESGTYGYQVYSRGNAGSEVEWSQAEQERALELPATLDPRVAALAREIVGDEQDPEGRMRRLERALSTRFQYTLDLPGEVADPLADFLFVRRAGHCEHFATALAVMLRTLGTPTRVMAGFYGGERTGREYLVRAGDAHAWVEAYLPGRGRVRLDATPPAGRVGAPNAVLDWVLRQYEALETKWQSSVLDYSFRDQAELTQRLITPPQRKDGVRLWPSRWHLTELAGLGAVGALVVLAFRRRARRTPPASTEAARLLDDAERILGRVPGLRDLGPGLEKVSDALERACHPLAPVVSRVVRRYLEAQFGRRPLVSGERRGLRAALKRAVARRL